MIAFIFILKRLHNKDNKNYEEEEEKSKKKKKNLRRRRRWRRRVKLNIQWRRNNITLKGRYIKIIDIMHRYERNILSIYQNFNANLF